MQLPRIAIIVFVLTLGLSSVALPTVDAGRGIKRDKTSEVEGVLTTLQGSTNTIIPQINNAVNSGANVTTLTPLVNDLANALNNATSSITSLQGGADLLKRQSLSGIVSIVTDLLTAVLDVVNLLDSLGSLTTASGEGDLTSGVKSGLGGLLTSLNTAEPGVLSLVSGLLGGGLSSILGLLGLGSILGLLGL